MTAAVFFPQKCTLKKMDDKRAIYISQVGHLLVCTYIEGVSTDFGLSDKLLQIGFFLAG
jgi:arginine utilization protein RocB